MILEFCNIGQLDIWLIDNKKKAYDRTFEMQLCKIVNGICDGMLHLEIKKLVHKSLAARNVLLNKPPRSSSSELIPKIYGFCPTPKIDEDGNEQIPIQSAAPEYFESATNLTSKSDVWSFGVVLWEIFSLGEEPYRGKTREGIRTFLNNGNRLRRPKLDFNYDLMTMCWHRDAGSRPTFEEIKCELEAHPHTLKAKSHYE
ncbi:ephrin type-A receptor 8-like [Saccostrea cucullata]|uniref:ephrin type-A receptor 8-like n=1 Tax=Saccostrea cuccullata TaxID=36930 RepID=UPI002ED66E46